MSPVGTHGVILAAKPVARLGMKIEHSPLMNEFISFWIETRVNGELRYETMLDFMRAEWHTNTIFGEKDIVLRGNLDAGLSENDMIEAIKPIVESAICAGRI